MRDGAVIGCQFADAGRIYCTAGKSEFAQVGGERSVSFACAPENLRLGTAIDRFSSIRIVWFLGVRDEFTRTVLESVYWPFTTSIEWMSVESAEMTKHAINSFLATSICFINEIAVLCEMTGADALEVERGLKKRHAHWMGVLLAPGWVDRRRERFRVTLTFCSLFRVAAKPRLSLIEGVQASNEHHKTWVQRRLSEAFGIPCRTFNSDTRTDLQAGHKYSPPVVGGSRTSALVKARRRNCPGLSILKLSNCRLTWRL